MSQGREHCPTDARTLREVRRSRQERAHEGVEQEIVGEMAAALGRAGSKLEEAIARVHAAGPAERPSLRRAVLRARWELEVHRESLGIRRHDDLDHLYPIPA